MPVSGYFASPRARTRLAAEGAHVHAENLPAVTVHDDHAERDTSALHSVRRDQMRFEWGTRDEGC
ncbi:hypothetical protein [Streptomyces hygroscopicus]|uniref:hypothetical protein n=1 Tax=Streptomyces hygroscopicus TaxID=1912 RepID=UPI002AD4EB29|nr:hypothetical protein [Streptomyces hygroscopicus]